MELVLLAALLGLIPAMIAHNKGHSAFTWWIFGAALFIIALPAALLAEDRGSDESLLKTGDRRACPHCAGPIRFDVSVCRHCGRDVYFDSADTYDPASELEAELLEHLDSHPQATTTELCTAVAPESRRNVERALWDLEDASQVDAVDVEGSSDLMWQRL